MVTPHQLLQFSFQEVFGVVRDEAHARRSISGSYYALFHTLCQAGASLFAGSQELRLRVSRSYDHGSFAAAAEAVEREWKIKPIDSRLVEVARAFKRLREARERADYQLEILVTWEEAEEIFWIAHSAIHQFNFVRDLSETADFLVAPLLRSSKRRG